MSDNRDNSQEAESNYSNDNNSLNLFEEIIQEEQLVGDVFSINYEYAKVLVNDFHRKKVGGIPSLCFLIATRVSPGEEVNVEEEDSCLILLRVMDATQIPQDREAEKIRVETAQRVSGESDKHWDSKDYMDLKTKHIFSFAGISCRIIGTFYYEIIGREHRLRFGSDISNFYPNRGMKVYKPNGNALRQIVNYFDPFNLLQYKEQFGSTIAVSLGKVRYASTNRANQGIDNVDVHIYPADLLGQKTALFGMTRTGKSNTTKIIAKSIYELRYPDNPEENKELRIGQLIFDPNGEYANENTQDADGKENPTALKNIWEGFDGATRDQEVITYGLTDHPNDPDRNKLLLNFYLNENLEIGKNIIDNSFRRGESKFIENFKQVQFDLPAEGDYSAQTRFRRKVLAYRALLAKAGFAEPQSIDSSTRGLFSKELLNGRPNATSGTRFNGMGDVQSDPDNAEKYLAAARIFEQDSPKLTALAYAFSALFDFTKTSEYRAFERWYIEERNNASGDRWADQDFENILHMIWRPNGAKQVGKVIDQHSAVTTSDYAEDIYNDLAAGKLVIIDQSSGDPEINKSSAERIMWKIFRSNQQLFREGMNPHEILIYIEEAHNLLPSGKDQDLTDVWVRTAKEGSKYRLGLVYATQEVSSIQKNILKNTANWFISHLNNKDETKELCKYYDFADFEPSILRAQDKGFLRVKTLSNLFVIPVQAEKFVLNLTSD